MTAACKLIITDGRFLEFCSLNCVYIYCQRMSRAEILIQKLRSINYELGVTEEGTKLSFKGIVKIPSELEPEIKDLAYEMIEILQLEG